MFQELSLYATLHHRINYKFEAPNYSGSDSYRKYYKIICNISFFFHFYNFSKGLVECTTAKELHNLTFSSRKEFMHQEFPLNSLQEVTALCMLSETYCE
jgi:hypothetical protein